MLAVTEHDFRDSFGEYMDCQNLDLDSDWLTDQPTFEWTYEELLDFEREIAYLKQLTMVRIPWIWPPLNCYTCGGSHVLGNNVESPSPKGRTLV